MKVRVGLTLACLVLGAVAVAQWLLWPLQSPSTVRTADRSITRGEESGFAAGTIPRFRLPPAAKFRAINERPLFVASRRLPDPDAKSKSNPELELRQQPKHLGLTAVLVTKDGPSALIVDAMEKTTHNLRTGDNLQGWEIVSIEPDRLILSQGESRLELPLRIFDPSPPAPSADPTKSDATKSKPEQPGDSGANQEALKRARKMRARPFTPAKKAADLRKSRRP